MTVAEAFILGLVQGLTEFLPVSSSGHLVLFGAFLEVNQGSLVFDVLVHVGTLAAVVFAYWGDVVELVRAAVRLAFRVATGRVHGLWDDQYIRLLLLLSLASVPVAVVGLLLEDFISGLFSSVPAVGVDLLVTGTLLWYASKVTRRSRVVEGSVNLRQALVVGAAQTLALLPGVSRSGTTISAGLFAGLSRSMAARFSFLLSLPAIAGAAVLQVGDIREGAVQLPVAAVGFITAAVSGYVAIRVLLSLLRAGGLEVFAYYTWLLGAAVLIVSVF